MRNTSALKQLLFDSLQGDSALVTLLGGDATRIKHGNPMNLGEYPCVTYQIIVEQDERYNTDQPANITRTIVRITTFSNSTSSSEADGIDDEVYDLWHGKRLSNTDMLVYTAYRVSRQPIFEPEINVWRVESNYEIMNVAK